MLKSQGHTLISLLHTSVHTLLYPEENYGEYQGYTD